MVVSVEWVQVSDWEESSAKDGTFNVLTRTFRAYSFANSPPVDTGVEVGGAAWVGESGVRSDRPVRSNDMLRSLWKPVSLPGKQRIRWRHRPRDLLATGPIASGVIVQNWIRSRELRFLLDNEIHRSLSSRSHFVYYYHIQVQHPLSLRYIDLHRLREKSTPFFCNNLCKSGASFHIFTVKIRKDLIRTLKLKLSPRLKYVYFSQGSVATDLRRGIHFKSCFLRRSFLNLTVKNYIKNWSTIAKVNETKWKWPTFSET